MLAGEKVDTFALARLENTINRMSWMLGLGKRKRPGLGPTEDPLEYAERFKAGAE